MKSLPEFPNYLIYKGGTVLNKKTGNVLNPKVRKCGYKSVTLYHEGVKKSFLVHRLVAMVWVENPDNLPEVNHIDEDKTNNNYTNLEWMTPQQNTEYSIAKSYSFINPQGIVVAIHNMRKSCKENGLNNAHMIAVSKGERNHHKNWRFNGDSKGD